MDRDRGGRDRERHPHERREDQRSRSAYNSYLSGFRGGRGRGGGGGNRRLFWVAEWPAADCLESLPVDLKMIQGSSKNQLYSVILSSCVILFCGTQPV